MIPSDDKHTLITEREPVMIKVFADNLVTYKVPCYKKQSPCKIYIKYYN